MDKKRFWGFVETKKDRIFTIAPGAIHQMYHLNEKIVTAKETCVMDPDQWCFQSWLQFFVGFCRDFYNIHFILDHAHDWTVKFKLFDGNWCTKFGSTFKAEINKIRSNEVKKINANPPIIALRILMVVLFLNSHWSLSKTASGFVNLKGIFPYRIK